MVAARKQRCAALGRGFGLTWACFRLLGKLSTGNSAPTIGKSYRNILADHLIGFGGVRFSAPKGGRFSVKIRVSGVRFSVKGGPIQRGQFPQFTAAKHAKPTFRPPGWGSDSAYGILTLYS